MAENNIAGFKKLMRYAQNLAEYEQGIADGIIDENVFVIVLEEKVAKFKGQTFDWSGGGEDIDISHLATKDELTNLANEMVANEEVHAAAYNDLDSRLKDIGSLISGVAVTKEEFQEGLQAITNEMVANEEVHAAALNDLDSRLKDIGSLISGVAVTKEEFQEGLQAITDEIVANEEVHAAAYSDLDSRLKTLEAALASINQ